MQIVPNLSSLLAVTLFTLLAASKLAGLGMALPLMAQVRAWREHGVVSLAHTPP